jgi:hypothetical protein
VHGASVVQAMKDAHSTAPAPAAVYAEAAIALANSVWLAMYDADESNAAQAQAMWARTGLELKLVFCIRMRTPLHERVDTCIQSYTDMFSD